LHSGNPYVEARTNAAVTANTLRYIGGHHVLVSTLGTAVLYLIAPNTPSVLIATAVGAVVSVVAVYFAGRRTHRDDRRKGRRR